MFVKKQTGAGFEAKFLLVVGIDQAVYLFICLFLFLIYLLFWVRGYWIFSHFFSRFLALSVKTLVLLWRRGDKKDDRSFRAGKCNEQWSPSAFIYLFIYCFYFCFLNCKVFRFVSPFRQLLLEKRFVLGFFSFSFLNSFEMLLLLDLIWVKLSFKSVPLLKN